MKDPRSPTEQFRYLMSGTEDARRQYQRTRTLGKCPYCDAEIDTIQRWMCSDCSREAE